MFTRAAIPLSIIDKSEALPSRAEPIAATSHHFVNGNSLHSPYPQGMRQILFGMGCFWGAERIFWNLEGAYVTAVGYAGGHTANATYEEVCSGRTGHTEAVLVVNDPKILPLEQLLKTFWENHNPTQGMRQGADMGTQYRSAIYVFNSNDHKAAIASRENYQKSLQEAGYGVITTEISEFSDPAQFYFAEHYHQQYLAKNPTGYCGIGGTGIACAVGLHKKPAN